MTGLRMVLIAFGGQRSVVKIVEKYGKLWGKFYKKEKEVRHIS